MYFYGLEKRLVMNSRISVDLQLAEENAPQGAQLSMFIVDGKHIEVDKHIILISCAV